MSAEWRGAGRLEDVKGSRDVQVELAGRHLGVFEEAGAPRWWPVERVRDEGGGRFDLGDGVRLAVSDLRLGALLAAVPRANPERLWPKAVAILGVLAAAVWLAWSFGLPALADLGARLVSAKQERQLGAAIADAFAPPATQARDEAAQQALNRVVAQLSKGFETEPPYEFTARLHCMAEVNAAAAPGGIIIVFDGLVRRMDTPEQLTAILAHEMAHGALRHGTRALFRRFALQIGVGLLMGDVTSVAALAAADLTDLGYSREDELEADREGARLMARAGFDPRAMVTMFAKVGEEEGRAEQGPAYLRTHPFATERQARIERLLGSLKRAPAVESDRGDWARLLGACPDQPEQAGQ